MGLACREECIRLVAYSAWPESKAQAGGAPHRGICGNRTVARPLSAGTAKLAPQGEPRGGPSRQQRGRARASTTTAVSRPLGRWRQSTLQGGPPHVRHTCGGPRH
eukprot:scaffold712_cov404-Prasinococcus_capsulatus_cf.AAC.20